MRHRFLIWLALPAALALPACERPADPASGDASSPDASATAASTPSSGDGEVVTPGGANVRPQILGSVYDTDFGELTVIRYGEDGAAGRYTGSVRDGSAGGAFSGQIEPADDEASGYDRIEGYWVQQTSSQRCDTERDGSYYWGRIQFNFMRDSDDYVGFFGHCEGSPLNRWNGRYLRQDPDITDAANDPPTGAAG